MPWCLWYRSSAPAHDRCAKAAGDAASTAPTAAQNTAPRDIRRSPLRAAPATRERRSARLSRGSKKRASEGLEVLHAESHLHLDQPLAQPLGDRLDAVGDLELLVDVLEVGAYRGAREAEDPRRLVVGEALGDQPEDLDLALGERADRRLLANARRQRLRLGRGARLLRDAEVPQQPARQVRLDHAAPRLHLADGVDHLLPGRALEQVSRGARLDRLDHLLLLVEDGEDEHLDRSEERRV